MYATVSRYTVLRVAGAGTRSRTCLPWPWHYLDKLYIMDRNYAVTDPEGISASGRTEEKEHTMLPQAKQASSE